jgi:hypothetical protein
VPPCEVEACCTISHTNMAPAHGQPRSPTHHRFTSPLIWTIAAAATGSILQHYILLHYQACLPQPPVGSRQPTAPLLASPTWSIVPNQVPSTKRTTSKDALQQASRSCCCHEIISRGMDWDCLLTFRYLMTMRLGHHITSVQ